MKFDPQKGNLAPVELTPALLRERLDRHYGLRDREAPMSGWVQCWCSRWYREEDFAHHVAIARKWHDGRQHGKR